MSEATHTVLWKRLTSALHGRSVGPAVSQGALAAEARSKLGTDLVDQFLNGYFFERQYGGGNSRLTDQQAEELVRQIENLPQFVAAIPAAASPSNGAWHCMDHPTRLQGAVFVRPSFNMRTSRT